ncbi:MAG: hypothetical protein MRY79_08675 [Alphaproteobacteria bacterium]|nr:hypothetical protein [Alphaproteobacteria bacterium]
MGRRILSSKMFGIATAAFAAVSVFATGEAKAEQFVDLSAQGHVELSDGTKVELPVSQDLHGRAIKVIKVVGTKSPVQFKAGHVSNKAEVPALFINETALNLPPHVFRFSLEHELAHHKLGHITNIINAFFARKSLEERAEMAKAYEKEADCYAVGEMKRSGVLKSDGVGALFQGTLKNGSAVHPSRDERIEHALSCFKKAKGPALVRK